jgi:hypothetical protein
MPGPIQRNAVVKFFGQPQATEGSVNEPRLREEHGFTFNEKWTYRQRPHDPADAVERVVYWQRYDYVGSVIRTTKDGDWVRDDNLPQALSRKP